MVGADFRSAKDVFVLVGAVKECLRLEGGERRNWHKPCLVELEEEVIQRAQGSGYIVMDAGCTPRVRGGVLGLIGSEKTAGILRD